MDKVKINLNYPAGATPLDPDEVNGLIPDISTQGELNIIEQGNILTGKNWAQKSKEDILTETFARKLHKNMYSDVWSWAGNYRQTQKTIGIDKEQISTQLHELMQNTKTWIEHQSYSWEEILARFHHKLVFIHPFPNGNGRYSRLHTELLATKNNQEIPTWGERTLHGGLTQDGEARIQYIRALKEADHKNLKPLIKFLKT